MDVRESSMKEIGGVELSLKLELELEPEREGGSFLLYRFIDL